MKTYTYAYFAQTDLGTIIGEIGACCRATAMNRAWEQLQNQAGCRRASILIGRGEFFKNDSDYTEADYARARAEIAA